MKKLHDKLYTYLLHSWNVTDSVIKFFEKIIKQSKDTGTNVDTLTDEDELKHLNHMKLLYKAVTTKSNKGLLLFDSYPDKIGNFLIYLLKINASFNHNDNKISVFNKDAIEKLNELFTIPGMNISLPNIAYLFTVNHFQQLIYEYSTSFSELDESSEKIEEIEAKDKLLIDYHSNIPPSFKQCYQQEFNNFKRGIDVKDDQSVIQKYMKKSPCHKIDKHNNCSAYCDWHNALIDTMLTKEEFLTIMKYALPQKGIVMKTTKQEHQLAKRILGTNNSVNSYKFAPAPLMIFCRYQKLQDWQGIDVGMSTRLCNDFHLTQTHVGMCLTKGFNDIQDKIQLDESPSNKYIHGATYFAKATFVIDLNNGQLAQVVPRTLDTELKNIQFQVHSTKNLAQILLASQDDTTRSVTLKGGMEYTFKIHPTGQIAQEAFKELSLEQRNCRLAGEVTKDSVFKKYSRNNCWYECKIIMASNTCGCVPWDFLTTNKSMRECDVFGRTCFLNKIEELTHLSKEDFNILSHRICYPCNKDCEYMKYHIKLHKEEKLVPYTVQDSKFFKCKRSNIAEIINCTGEFYDILMDKNNTFQEKFLYQHAEKIDNIFFLRSYMAMRRYRNQFIVIHLHFVTPEVEVNVLTAKYTVIDKIAGFGGTFGLLTQFTGCSILAIIHMIVLFFKELYHYNFKRFMSD